MTAEAVSQEVGTVLNVKPVKDSNNNSGHNKKGLNGMYLFALVYCIISVPACSKPIAVHEMRCMYLSHQLMCCFFAPLRWVFTRVLPV